MANESLDDDAIEPPNLEKRAVVVVVREYRARVGVGVWPLVWSVKAPQKK